MLNLNSVAEVDQLLSYKVSQKVDDSPTEAYLRREEIDTLLDLRLTLTALGRISIAE